MRKTSRHLRMTDCLTTSPRARQVKQVPDTKTAIDAFFSAFNRHDPAVMAASYEPDAVFDDPVFGFLSGTDAGWMWRMLLAKTDLTVEHTTRLSEDGAVVDWVARYTYATAEEKAAGTRGRPVENRVRSTITMRDGKIVRQHDFFSFARWARQALPLTPVQRLLTYTPLVVLIRKAVHKGATDALRAFREKNNG